MAATIHPTPVKSQGIVPFPARPLLCCQTATTSPASTSQRPLFALHTLKRPSGVNVRTSHTFGNVADSKPSPPESNYFHVEMETGGRRHQPGWADRLTSELGRSSSASMVF